MKKKEEAEESEEKEKGTLAEELAEGPAKNKAEAKAGTERHKGIAKKAMLLFQKQGKK